jgi:PAS domain S-box-containing protein
MEIELYQIGILIIPCLIVPAWILMLFRFRLKLGFSMLYVTLGLIQYLQFYFVSTLYAQVANGIIVYAYPSILSSASLFTVLLVYIKEDAIETRKVIYALLISNVVLVILLFLPGLQFNQSNPLNQSNPFRLSMHFFDNRIRILFVGAIALLIDSIIIIVLYEFVSKFVTNLLLRIYITMFLVLSIDTLVCSFLACSDFEKVKSMLIPNLITKFGTVIIYGLLFYVYLKYFEKESYHPNISTFKDIFYMLSYKQKFEYIQQLKEEELKKAEVVIQLSLIRYQTLTNNAPVGIFLTKPDGYTIYVNPKWSLISGLSSERALGYGWLDAVHPDDKTNTANGWELATNSKRSSYAEYRFIHPDGTVKWVLGQAIPEINTSNEIIGYVGTITDITEIKKFEKELQFAKEKAEESDRLKTIFLQNLSHEIRTPLNAICGFSGFLDNENLENGKRQNYIRIIKKSSNKLLSIVSDILTVSSLETNQEEVFVDKVSVNQLMAKLFSEYRLLNENIILELLPEIDDQQLEIYTDEAKITQILTCLIDNSLKFTPSGMVKFGYNLPDNLNENPMIQFYVEDNGIGIEVEMHEKIFEPFCQANEIIQTTYGGTGLGLSISKGFVELLGGKIWLDSQLGKGSTFYFTIPYRPVPRGDIEEKVENLED